METLKLEKNFPWNGKTHITGGVSQISRAKDGPNEIGWGALNFRDNCQTDNARTMKRHVRAFDEKRLQQFVYQQDGFSATLDKKLGFKYSDSFSIRQMREEIMAILGKQKKKGNYSEYRSKRDSRLHYFEGDESVLQADKSIPEMNLQQNHMPFEDSIFAANQGGDRQAEEYFIPEAAESPMGHLHLRKLHDKGPGRSSTINKDLGRMSDQQLTTNTALGRNQSQLGHELAEFGIYKGNESSPHLEIQVKSSALHS